MSQKVEEKNDASSLFNAFSGASSLAWTVILKALFTQKWNSLSSFSYVIPKPYDFRSPVEQKRTILKNIMAVLFHVI